MSVDVDGDVNLSASSLDKILVRFGIVIGLELLVRYVILDNIAID